MQRTPEERAAALAAVAANGGNILLTARELGLPLSTLRTWVHGRHSRKLNAPGWWEVVWIETALRAHEDGHPVPVVQAEWDRAREVLGAIPTPERCAAWLEAQGREPL